MKEHVAEFRYRPAKCKKDYRVVVVWKELDVYRGQQKLFDDARCFFYITNDWENARRGDRLRGQRPLQPREPAGATQGRRAVADGAGGQPALELGVHGDGLVGLEPEGLGRLAVAGGRPLAGEAWGGKAEAVADGLSHVSAGDDAGSRANPLGGAEDRLSAVGVESLAIGLLPSVGSTSPAACVAEGKTLKPESGCSGPQSPRTALSATESEHETRSNPNPLPTRSASAAPVSPAPTAKNHSERLRRSLV